MKKQITLLCAGVVLSAPSSFGVLVAHYTFDEGAGTTAADSATADGAQDAATNQGTVGWTTGLVGGALDLPGNASMQIVDPLGPGTTAFTITAWVNLDDAPAYDGIFSARNVNWGLNVNQTGTGLAFDYRFDNSPGGGSSGLDSPGGSATVDRWHHLAMTWITDGANSTGKIYLDGVKLGPEAIDTSLVYDAWDVNDRWNIGDDPCCGGRELNAQLDDLAVWDEVLTDQQITNIYNGGLAGVDAPTAVPEPSMSLLAGIGLLGLIRRRSR